ncbi:MAG: ABC transporter permease [Blautia sp.]|nr:ABC transporter permease [Blautia sp.]
METIKNNPIIKKLGFNRIILFIILLLMYGVFSVIIPGFASKARLMSILNYVYFLGFLALGVTFVIATGGIDFSIGPVMFCCALMAGYSLNTFGMPVIVSLLLTIAIGVCFGCFNGFLVAFVGVPPFIVSMATMNIAKGLGSVFTKTQSVSWPQSNDPSGNGWFRNLVKVNGIPTGLIALAIAAIVLYIVMNNTRAGRFILCLGSNKEAVRLSGVDVRKWQMLAYVICGTMAGIAAIFFVSAYTTVQPGLGDTYNNEAIASCVMGGTSMGGGLASIGGTLIGVFVISLLQEGIMAMRMTKEVQMIITGLIVIVFVYADVSARRRRN